MGVITNASVMHMIVVEADVSNSQDYDFLVSLAHEVNGHIHEMQEKPSVLAQYKPLLRLLREDQARLYSRIEDLQNDPERQIYLSEYFEADSVEEGPELFGQCEDQSYFVRGTIHWDFSPASPAELMENTGLTWEEVSEDDIYQVVWDNEYDWFKYGGNDGTHDSDYGSFSWQVEFGEPEPNT